MEYEQPAPPPAPAPDDGEWTWNNFAWIKIDHHEELEEPAEEPKKRRK